MEIRRSRDERELAAALALREAVFAGEQGRGGGARGRRPGGRTGGRTAVRIGMLAQTGALGLYERAGYTPYGPRFQEQGIEHLGMEKRLA